jgi:transcriptional regulator with XRE-family HTH domain
MGYRGKLAEREQARRLRASGLPMAEIAARLGVSKSSVSLWVRDVFANSDPRMVAFFCSWLRHFFRIDESRLRVRIYLHQGLDLAAATAFWSEVTGVPESQFLKPYRAAADPSIRHAQYVHGCVGVRYSCSVTHRSIMGLVVALLRDAAIPG